MAKKSAREIASEIKSEKKTTKEEQKQEQKASQDSEEETSLAEETMDEYEGDDDDNGGNSSLRSNRRRRNTSEEGDSAESTEEGSESETKEGGNSQEDYSNPDNAGGSGPEESPPETSAGDTSAHAGEEANPAGDASPGKAPGGTEAATEAGANAGADVGATSGANAGATSAGASAATAGAETGAATAGAGVAAESGAAAGASAGAAAGGAAVAATPVGWAILIIAIIIVLILIIVGIVSFFQTMPGLISGQIKELANKICTFFVSITTENDVDAQITDEDIAEVAQYVEDMGFDLYSMGFGKPVYEEDESKDNYGKIIKMDDSYASPLFYYIYADTRTYTRQKDFSFWLWLKNTSLIGFIANCAFGADGKGEGMLVVSNDLGASATVDYDSKTLTLSRKQEGLNVNWNDYTYSLDGWAGRYGMPLNFSIALHLATMKPDLVTTIINTFDTKVYIEKYTTSISVIPSYVDDETEKVYYYDVNGEHKDDEEEENKTHLQDSGLTPEQIQKIATLYKANISIYQPYITKVENHWYYGDINFGKWFDTSRSI